MSTVITKTGAPRSRGAVARVHQPPWPAAAGQGGVHEEDHRAQVGPTPRPVDRIRRANWEILFLLRELRAATTEVERELLREWIGAARVERTRAEEALALAPPPRRASRA